MDKEALQILNMFLTATQIAKSKNVHEFKYHIQRTALLELFKKAFPFVKDETNLLNIVDIALSNS